MALVLGAFLALWLLLTVVKQLPGPWLARLFTRDRLGLVPGWTFFAPHPGTYDYHPLVRYRVDERELSPWRELDLGIEARTSRALVWNPHKRGRKALFDLTMDLGTLARSLPEKLDDLQFSVPYLALLQAAARAPEAQFGNGVQFILVQNARDDTPPAVIFVSRLHDL
jgi:hypothetical protein